MNPDAIIDALVVHLGDPVVAGGGKEFRWNCPFCEESGKRPDSKRHLYANPSKGVFICHRCGKAGKANVLLRRFGIREPERYVYDATLDEVWEMLASVGIPAKGEVVEETPIDMPMVPVEKGMLSYAYLKKRFGSRQVDKAIKRYRLSVGTGFYRNRVIVPTYHHGDLVFFVARSILDEEPKYLNPKGRSRRKYLFGYDRAKKAACRGWRIVVTEGVFSAMSVDLALGHGFAAVATFGKYVTRQQLRLIADVSRGKVLVMLDADAQNEAQQCAAGLKALGVGDVLVCELPEGTDPDDMRDQLDDQWAAWSYPYDDLSGVERMMEGLR